MNFGRRLRLFTFSALAVVLLHFLITALYSLDYLPLPHALRSAVNSYTLPFFHQNWKLFAPSVPEYTVQLEFREKKESLWTNWADVSQGCGFHERSKVEYMEQTINGGLAWQVANNMYTVNQVRQLDRVMESYDYNRAIYFLYSLKKRIGDPLTDSAQIRLRFDFTPPPHQAKSAQMSYLEFPTYQLQP
jgi:hypothetical protein